MARRLLSLALLAALATVPLAPAPAAPTPATQDATQADLLGLWRADFEGVGHVATLLLTKHPTAEESFHGTIDRDSERRQLAGDIDTGDLTLEESADGMHIAATWLGEVVEGSCAREIRGTWSAEAAPADIRNFVLRKVGD